MKALLFDLDGTLLNTIADLHQSTNFALQKHHFPTHSLEAIQSFVGDGLRMLIRRALPVECDETCVQTVLAEMKLHYTEHCHDFTSIYDGIVSMLNACKNAGFLIGVVSNKADMLVKKLCKHFFDGIISVAIGESGAMPRKPAADMVFAAIRQLGAKEAYYIGDSDVDIRTAENAALPCLSVSWGFRSADVLQSAGAKIIFDSPLALQEYILHQI